MSVETNTPLLDVAAKTVAPIDARDVTAVDVIPLIDCVQWLPPSVETNTPSEAEAPKIREPTPMKAIAMPVANPVPDGCQLSPPSVDRNAPYVDGPVKRLLPTAAMVFTLVLISPLLAWVQLAPASVLAQIPSPDTAAKTFDGVAARAVIARDGNPEEAGFQDEPPFVETATPPPVIEPAMIVEPFAASAETGPGGPSGIHWAWRREAEERIVNRTAQIRARVAMECPKV